MKYTIKKQDLAIITNDKIEKSFDNEDCFLHGVIEVVKDDTINQKRTYRVRTDLALYEEKKIYQFNEAGEDILDENGDRVFSLLKTLVAVEQKQDWSLHTFGYAEIDGFTQLVASQIPEGLTRTQKDILELKLMFLYKRDEESPWGIDVGQWRLRTDEDFRSEVSA